MLKDGGHVTVRGYHLVDDVEHLVSYHQHHTKRMQFVMNMPSAPGAWCSETKRWVCDYQGCSKSFQRKGHLRRHYLNREYDD